MSGFRGRWPVLLLAALLLTAAAWLRGAEYDEQYTLFLTAGTARPDWPQTMFRAGAVTAVQAGHASFGGIVRDLRATDVHPPLYFWAVSVWRWIFGPGLFAARLFSVLCGTTSVALVGAIAKRCRLAPATPMLLTLGCYGFVYTNAIARGFAPAETLTLGGMLLLLNRRPAWAGLCLGAACTCNYLAVFAASAAIAVAGAWLAIPAMVPFLALDAWFFAAQHAARPGQFPPFAIWPNLIRLAAYQTASVFGGLPLYVSGNWRLAVQAVIGLVAVALAVSIARARPWLANPAIRTMFAAALAPPAGLLLLGAVFDNSPIELRYLSFGLPFVALMLVWAGPTAATARIRPLLVLLLTLQIVSIAGLLFSPRTMQPARAAATAAAHLPADTIVLLPAGNDGVGIVGAFAIESPPALPILVFRAADPIAGRIVPFRRVALAALAQDPASVAAIAALHAILAPPNWRRVGIGLNLEIYERTGKGT